MKATGKLSPVQQAYVRCEAAHKALREIDAMCMEATEDKRGILWERWIICTPPTVVQGSHVSLILFATPSWWDIFAPLTEDTKVDGTIAALKELAKKFA